MPIKIIKENTNLQTSVSHHPEIIKTVMVGKNCQSPEIFPIKNKISPEVFPKRGQK